MLQHVSDCRRRILLILAVLIVPLSALNGAHADFFSINFNTNYTFSPLYKLNSNSSNADIGSALTKMLSSSYQGASVTVTGAEIQNNYTGDGHVVGPTFTSHGKTTNVAWNLGDSLYIYNGKNGPITLAAPTSIPSKYGNFLTNASATDDTTITMTFSHFSVSSISFAFEIFPDASEQGSKHPADFTFQGGNLSGSVFHPVNMSFYSVTSAYSPTPPVVNLSGDSGTSWTALAVAPGSQTTSYTHSSSSGSGTEQSAQLLGTATVIFQQPVTTLEFQDWPAMIGINDLLLNQPFDTVTPAPPSAVLFGIGVVPLVAWLVRSRRCLLVAV